MGRPRVVLANIIAGIVPTGPTADTGYQLSWVTDDVPSRVFRNSAAVTSLQVIVDRGAGVLAPIDTWAAFGCGGATTGPGNLGNMQVESGPNIGSVVPILSMAPTSRGDFLGLTSPNVDRVQRWTVTLRASEKVVVGTLFAGGQILLPYFSGLVSPKPDRGSVANDTDGGATFSARIRSKREVRQAAWHDALDSIAHAALVNVDDTLDGAYTPFLFQPDSDDMSTFFHGRLTDSSGWSEDPSFTFAGHRLAFTESGRGL